MVKFITCIFFCTLMLQQHVMAQNTKQTTNAKIDLSKRYNKQQLDSLSFILINYFNEDNHEGILEYAPKLLKNAQDIKSYDLELRYRNILGNAYIGLDDFKHADIFFNESLEIGEKRKDTMVILDMYVNLGNTYFYNEPFKAAQYLKRGLRYNYKGPKNEQLFFILNHNLAELYINEGQPNLAKIYLDKSLYYLDLEAIAPRRDHFYGTTRFLLAGINNLENQPTEAIRNSLESLKYKELYDENYRLGNYKILMTSYEKLGQFENATQIHKVYDSLRDKRFKKDKIKQQQIARIGANLDRVEQDLKTSKLEKDLAVQKASKSNFLLWIFIISAVSFLIIAVILLITRNKRGALLDGLRARNKQYLEAKEKSEQLAASNTKFLSTISHELRTPLYGIIGVSSSLLKDKRLDAFKDDFETLKFSADYLLSLVNDVLEFNKYSATNKIDMHEKDFDLKILLQNILKSFKFLNVSHNNKISIDIGSDVPHILYADYTKLSQILMNLVSNASKFTHDGTIVIKVENLVDLQDLVRLKWSVIDTGRGILPEDQKAVFNEFNQGSNFRNDDVKGTGLGLPIVNKILTLLNSSLEMNSVFNKGTTFSFILDIKKGDKQFIKTDTLVIDKSSLKNKSILIVDDNKINQLVTKKMLEQYEMEFVTAFDGKEAVALATKNNFDFILMDINMPVMNGIEASIKIREFDKVTPIIALTATNFVNPEVEIYSHGINNILVKPFNTDNLIQLLVNNCEVKV